MGRRGYPPEFRRKVLLYTPGRGLSGWDWFWVVLAGILDIGHWAAGATQRNQIPGRRASAA
jgi:hypothetical protein